MYDPFNLALTKAKFNFTETADGHETGQIRWGIFEGTKHEVKIAAFFIPVTEGINMGKEVDFVDESEKIITTNEAQNGPLFQAYEWSGRGFESIPADQQTWFKFW